MACPIPRWPHGENNLRVQIERGGRAIGKGGGVFSLQVVPHWDAYVGARLGKVTGGSVLTISGYGFRAVGQGLDYVGYGDLAPRTPHLKPSTLNPKPSTLNPKPSTLNPTL